MDVCEKEDEPQQFQPPHQKIGLMDFDGVDGGRRFAAFWLAALALPACDATTGPAALAFLAGAILGAAAARWRTRTPRPADPAPDDLAGHWRATERRRADETRRRP
jgi:hypothetical protein